MSLPAEPLKAIFPIVGVRKVPDFLYFFLGTGFFIRTDGSFLTAKHIFENVQEDEFNAVLLDLKVSGATPYRISSLKFSEKFDMALGRVEEVQDIQPLNLANKNAPMNFDIITTEYSGTRSEQLENGRGVALTFSPIFRKRNVMRYYQSTFPGKVPTEYIDVSFPALKGASGAPLVVERDGSVIGMVVGNVERELLPAQIERITTEDGKHTEETKYFLPYGLAISWKHLSEFIEQANKYKK